MGTMNDLKKELNEQKKRMDDLKKELEDQKTRRKELLAEKKKLEEEMEKTRKNKTIFNTVKYEENRTIRNYSIDYKRWGNWRVLLSNDSKEELFKQLNNLINDLIELRKNLQEEKDENID